MSNGPKTKGNPPILDTTKITGGTDDPRGDNRPGVLPDPPQDGIDPVTNLREDLVDKSTGTPKPVTEWPTDPLNQHPADAGRPAASTEAPKGRMIKMIMDRDYWPRTRPADFDGDEYRVKAGEEVELPEEEAMDVMESGIGHRANRRA